MLRTLLLEGRQIRRYFASPQPLYIENDNVKPRTPLYRKVQQLLSKGCQGTPSTDPLYIENTPIYILVHLGTLFLTLI